MRRSTQSASVKSTCRLHPRFVGLAMSLLMLPLSSPALMKIGNGALLGDVSAGVEYTSDAERAGSGEPDTLLRVGPSLRYESLGSVVQTQATISLQAVRYLENSQSNDLNLGGDLSLSYPNGLSRVPYSININLGAEQRTEENSDLGLITRTTLYSGGTSGRYTFGERLFLSAGLEASREVPDDTSLSERDSFGVPLSIGVRYSEELSYSLGYRYRQESGRGGDFEQSEDSTDHALFLSVNGQLMPLLSGSLSLGIQQRTFNDSGTEELLPYASGNLDWQISDLTSANLTLSSDFESNIANQSTERLRAGIGISHTFNEFWSAGGSVSWENVSISGNRSGDSGSFPGRDEESVEFGIGVAYRIAQRITVNLQTSYENRDASEGDFSTDRFSVAMSTSIPF